MIKKILVAFLLINSVALTAQRTNSSPYSFFGFGDEFSPRTVEQNSMGGIGVAFDHYKYLNFSNPAAYANLRYTTYSLGALNSNLTIKNNETNQSTNATSLSYFAVAFPLGNKGGFSVGIQPVSSVGYSLTNSFPVNNPTEITLYSGDGGVNRFYGSLGLKIFKGFSLGIEADYKFGNVENLVTNQRVNVILATRNREKVNIQGGSVKIGTQYKKELKNKLLLSGGATIQFGNDLEIDGVESEYTLTLNSNGEETIRDTRDDVLLVGDYLIPVKTNFGVGLGKFDKWYVGVEYENQEAIQTTGALNNNNAVYGFEDSSKFALGGFYIPKINSISSYWQRVTYRAGLRFQETGLLIKGAGTNPSFTPIDDFGISFGLGLPLKQLSSINMGFEFGQRGTTENNLIQENYFNFRLSLSLTDTNWFQKRKID